MHAATSSATAIFPKRTDRDSSADLNGRSKQKSGAPASAGDVALSWMRQGARRPQAQVVECSLGMEPRICEFGFPGPLRDRLVNTVLSGVKTATSLLLADR